VQDASFGDATLGLQGASITVPLTVTCQQGWNVAFGNAHVAQANRGRLAQGFGSFENTFPGVPCTGQPQAFSILIPNSSPWAFARGEAEADGIVNVFNEAAGELVFKTIDPQEIEIRSGSSQLAPAPAAPSSPDPRFLRT
jgi:hypothetical protein